MSLKNCCGVWYAMYRDRSRDIYIIAGRGKTADRAIAEGVFTVINLNDAHAI